MSSWTLSQCLLTISRISLQESLYLTGITVGGCSCFCFSLFRIEFLQGLFDLFGFVASFYKFVGKFVCHFFEGLFLCVCCEISLCFSCRYSILTALKVV